MARKQSRIPSSNSPLMTDDFRLIKGIGSALTERLHGAGIQTYNELASMSPSQIAEKVGGLSAKQISKQDWIGQARKLAAKQLHTKTDRKETPKRTIRQHYENFTIEFLMDDKKIMRRTRVVHIQSGDADTWVGWEADQLISFLTRHSGTQSQEGKKSHQKPSVVSAQSLKSLEEESSFLDIKNTDSLTLVPNIYERARPNSENDQPILHSPATVDFSGALRLKDLRVLLIGSTNPIYSLRQDQPFHVQLTLILTHAVVGEQIPIRYKATINFKKFGGASYPVAEETHIVKLTDCMKLDIPCTNPPPGLYRPEALINLFSTEMPWGLMASLKGDLIQFF